MKPIHYEQVVVNTNKHLYHNENGCQTGTRKTQEHAYYDGCDKQGHAFVKYSQQINYHANWHEHAY